MLKEKNVLPRLEINKRQRLRKRDRKTDRQKDDRRTTGRNRKRKRDIVLQSLEINKRTERQTD